MPTICELRALLKADGGWKGMSTEGKGGLLMELRRRGIPIPEDPPKKSAPKKAAPKKAAPKEAAPKEAAPKEAEYARMEREGNLLEVRAKKKHDRELHGWNEEDALWALAKFFQKATDGAQLKKYWGNKEIVLRGEPIDGKGFYMVHIPKAIWNSNYSSDDQYDLMRQVYGKTYTVSDFDVPKSFKSAKVEVTESGLDLEIITRSPIEPTHIGYLAFFDGLRHIGNRIEYMAIKHSHAKN
jgi:hypothetical protein